MSGSTKAELEAAAHRRGVLHASLDALIEAHGVEDVRWMLGVVEEDRGLAPGLPRVVDGECARCNHKVADDGSCACSSQ